MAKSDPWSSIHWVSFEKGEAPSTWSDTAIEIAADKYFRKRGVNGGRETSVRQLFGRVVRAVRQAGEWQGYFKSPAEAETFENDLAHILLHQKASFNSPVYFNVGLFTEYSILGTAENFVFDPKRGEAVELSSAYLHPQASACFIQDVKDDLISIFDLLKNEAKLFKYGSGTGTNFSSLRARGEALDGGGESTGLISYLEVFDKAAQAIKSGGTTRRAAKMVVVDADHPEIMDFIRWKMLEERKARVLLAQGYSGGMEGEAFRTVSGQNSNNSVRVTDDFLHRVLNNDDWELRSRIGGRVVETLKAKDLWREMARAAWECADPGVQFHDTIQKWHVCPNSGEIRSSNPCSEYMFLDNSACNLASLNLAAFLKNGQMDWENFAHTVRVMLLAQDILVDYAAYPTAKIAENSHRFRPLGLGYANLGGVLMRQGIPYDSFEAARFTARVTAYMHALALEQSAEMAKSRGAFDGWQANREPALAVLKLHQQAWKDREEDFEAVDKTFARAIQMAETTGLRNAQVTLIAPTGTIGLLMDCDTLGIEPDFSLNKRKTLAGGGELILINQSLKQGLESLGYTHGAIEDIQKFVRLNGTVVGAPGFDMKHAAVFDTAVPPAAHPERRISAQGHLRVMSAAQPFLSGAISKTVNLPASTTVDDIENLYLAAWKLGLKSLAVYRDGSKALQPLCAEC